jgi:peptide-methionine (S)-S-oxide reductase
MNAILTFLAITVLAGTPSGTGNQEETMRKATFGGGCFWCVEAIFERVEGVSKVVSGFAGGDVPNPTYREVTGGRTGHAEVVQITYDPAVITYDELLEIFWMTHDPTTLNRQGNDVGPMYRSIVLYHDQEQRGKALYYKQKIEEAEIYDRPIVTEIVPLNGFWTADGYHQDYFANNPDQAYCQFVILPKVQKFKEIFRERLKEEYRVQN